MTCVVPCKQAYRELARQLHPDKGGSTAAFNRLQHAYQVLSCPQQRRAYDLLASDVRFRYRGRLHKVGLGVCLLQLAVLGVHVHADPHADPHSGVYHACCLSSPPRVR